MTEIREEIKTLEAKLDELREGYSKNFSYNARVTFNIKDAGLILVAGSKKELEEDIEVELFGFLLSSELPGEIEVLDVEIDTLMEVQECDGETKSVPVED